MELADLRAFVEAAEHGTFTAGAAALHTTQPSLSRSIARLERELGGLLFDRGNRRAPKLAPLGEATLPTRATSSRSTTASSTSSTPSPTAAGAR